MEIRLEIENVGDFEEIKKALKDAYPNKKIYELTLLNID